MEHSMDNLHSVEVDQKPKNHSSEDDGQQFGQTDSCQEISSPMNEGKGISGRDGAFPLDPSPSSSSLKMSDVVAEITKLRTKVAELEALKTRSHEMCDIRQSSNPPALGLTSFQCALDWYAHKEDDDLSDEDDAKNDYEFHAKRLQEEMHDELRRERERLDARKKFLSENRTRKLAQKRDKVKIEGTPEITESTGNSNTLEYIPSLKYVGWTEFNTRPSSNDSRFVIEILTKDVQSALHVASQPSHLSEPGHGDFRSLQTDQEPGRAILPERIRINSRFLLECLEKHCKSTPTLGNTASVVMIRPFKTLTYYLTHVLGWPTSLKHNIHSYDTDPTKQSWSPVDKHIAECIVQLEESSSLPFNSGYQLGSSTTGGTECHDETRTTPSPECKAVSMQVANSEDNRRRHEIQHGAILAEFLHSAIMKKMAHLSSLNYNKISFPDIWHLFQPGDEVIHKNGRQAYRIIGVVGFQREESAKLWQKRKNTKKCEFEDNTIVIRCARITFDGRRFGPVSEDFRIVANKDQGEMPVTSLPVYPIRLHGVSEGGSDLKDPERQAKSQALRERLIKRGKLFYQVAGVRHMYYAGCTLDTKQDVESEVVIDFEECFSAGDAHGERLEAVAGSCVPSSHGEVDRHDCDSQCREPDLVHAGSCTWIEQRRSEALMQKLAPDAREESLPIAIQPRYMQDLKGDKAYPANEDFLVMSDKVFGFVLRSRRWATLDIEALSELEHPVPEEEAGLKSGTLEQSELERRTAFGKLVLPQGHKEMVLSLVAQHFRNKASSAVQHEHVDIVRGKGKGLIILLHGAPGVGKTTTAEGVAELFKKPLFQITCGDLGATAKDVERSLETNFALASKWDCVLLLDEADVFLAARSRDDFARNGLVAVFLRTLEYYTGILFLTTTRVGDFDEAFASRIHISLYYPPLDLPSTRKVFELNLGMIKERFRQSGRVLSMEDIDIAIDVRDYWKDNPKARWNGRQIRNACQTALALAEFDAQGKSHTSVHDPTAEFMKYLKDIYGAYADERAKEGEFRASESTTRVLQPEIQPNVLGVRQQGFPNPSYHPQSSAAQTHANGAYQSSQQPFYTTTDPRANALPSYGGVQYQTTASLTSEIPGVVHNQQIPETYQPTHMTGYLNTQPGASM